MHLIDDHVRRAGERRVGLQRLEQHADRAEEQPAVRRDRVFEPNLEADQLADGRAALRRDAMCDGRRRDATRLRRHHDARLASARTVFVDELRQLCGLAATRRAENERE